MADGLLLILNEYAQATGDEGREKLVFMHRYLKKQQKGIETTIAEDERAHEILGEIIRTVENE